MNRHLGDFWTHGAEWIPGWGGMLVAALVIAGCGQAPEAEPAQPALQVLTRPALEADGYEAFRQYTGRVEAAAESEVGFEIGGLLAEALVDEGDLVADDQVLARLDTARLQARRAELAAALEEVRAQFQLARATLARTEEALGYRGVSRQQYDEAEKQARALKAALAVAEARLAALDVDLDKAVLRAPFAGVVVSRIADPGVVVGAGQALFHLQSVAAPEVRMGLAADAVDSIRTGQEYPIEIRGRTFQAMARAIVPRRDDITRTVDVLFVLDHTQDRIRPGDLARLQLESRFEEPGFWVPVGALAEGPRGLWTNYVAEPIEDAQQQDEATHRVVPRVVELLHADTERAFVKGTLRDGDLLIVDGLQRIVPGQAVALADSSAHDGYAARY